MAGLLVGAIQAGFLFVAVTVWGRTAGSWTGAAYAGYFLALVILAPLVAWVCAARVVDAGVKAWHAWPVSLTSLVILVFGHGFEEAGLPSWAPVATMAIFSMLVGTLVFSRRDYRRAS